MTPDITFASLVGGLLDLPEDCTLGRVLFDGWPDLRAKRARLDAAIEVWIAELPEPYPQLPMRYQNSKGVAREHCLAGHDAFFHSPDAPRPPPC